MARKTLESYIKSQENHYDFLSSRVKEEVDYFTGFYRASLLNSLSSCESPIEQLFHLSFRDAADEMRKELHVLAHNTALSYNPQYVVLINKKKYRLDFSLICSIDDKTYKFAIECDGHDFHEKTKEQASRDKERERALIGNGFTVIRFTGSEIWRSPFKCAMEASNIIKNTIGLNEYWYQQVNGDAEDSVE